jgi:hypothetical protein
MRYGSLAARFGAVFKQSYWNLIDSHGVIVVTHCGKLGDFIACLPVASWLYKTRGKKIHFVLARSFHPFIRIRSLLMLQEMTAEVTLAEFPVKDWECGGTPYRFDPNRYCVPAKEYYNLGFRRRPQRFVTQYVAEEHGLGYDANFRLGLGEYQQSDEILCSDKYMLSEIPRAAPIDLSASILENAQRMAGARESHVSQSGLFHLLDWAGVTPTKVYIYPHSANIHLFSTRLDDFSIEAIHRAVR